MSYTICWEYTRTGQCDKHDEHIDGPLGSYTEDQETEKVGA